MGFLAFESPIPTPLPANWTNDNIWHVCLINGNNLGGKVTLMDQSTNPPTNVTWSTFTGNSGNPNWVPQYDGNDVLGHPNASIDLVLTIKPAGALPIRYRWAGLQSCKVGPNGGSICVGFSFDPGVYPQES